MKNVIIIACLFLMSCGIANQLNLSSITIGMSKQEVLANLKKKPNQVIAAKKTPRGNLEVYQFDHSNLTSGKLEYYWLYFLDDKLIKWGPREEFRYGDSYIEDAVTSR